MTVSESSVPVRGVAGSDETTRGRLRKAVEGLADIERRATTRGERASAEWVARHLLEAGAVDVRLVPYKAHSTWAVALLAHSIVVLAASVAGGLVARAVAALGAVSLEADATGRSFWLRSLLPGKGRGTSVQGGSDTLSAVHNGAPVAARPLNLGSGS